MDTVEAEMRKYAEEYRTNAGFELKHGDPGQAAVLFSKAGTAFLGALEYDKAADMFVAAGDADPTSDAYYFEKAIDAYDNSTTHFSTKELAGVYNKAIVNAQVRAEFDRIGRLSERVGNILDIEGGKHDAAKEAYLRAARCFKMVKKFDEAFDMYDKCGKIEFKAGGFEAAIAFYHQALGVGSKDYTHFVLTAVRIALCYMAMRDWKMALRSLDFYEEKGIRPHPEFVNICKEFSQGHDDVAKKMIKDCGTFHGLTNRENSVFMSLAADEKPSS